MHDGGDNLCSWLLKTGVLIAWCPHRPTNRRTVNDTRLRAPDVFTNTHALTAPQRLVAFVNDSCCAWRLFYRNRWVECS